MKAEELAKLGIKKVETWVKIPSEWTPSEYSEVNTLNGPTVMIRFERPNEEAIHLFGNQVEKRPEGWFAKNRHVVRQIERAKKFE